MKLWGVLCIMGCCSALNAQSDNAFEVPDKKSGIGVVSHVEEETSQDDADEMKADLSTFLKDASEAQTAPEEDLEQPEPFLIVTTDTSSPPGGGVRFIDPKIEKMLIPLRDVPWWERWWNAVTSWFSDESSDANS